MSVRSFINTLEAESYDSLPTVNKAEDSCKRMESDVNQSSAFGTNGLVFLEFPIRLINSIFMITLSDSIS